MQGLKTIVAGIAAAMMLAGCGGASSGDNGDDPIRIGLLTSLSGPLAPFGKAYAPAFEAGLEHATDGTMEVNGRKIEVVKVDDQGDQAAAISGATKLVSDGVEILGGTMSSGAVPALADFAKTNSILYFSGFATTDKATGANNLTFRSGPEYYQHVMAISTILGDDAVGKRVCLLHHDLEYGNALVRAAKAQLADQVGEFKTISVPFPTPDVAPYVLQLKNADCDVVIPFLAGSVSDFWQAFQQQGITAHSLIISAVGAKVDWPTYAKAQTKNVRLFASYFVPDSKQDTSNPADAAMFEALAAEKVDIDYPSADGFGFATSLVEAIKKAGSDDPEKVAAALAGQRTETPRGQATIRKQDHALIAPMVQFHFEGDKRVLDQVIAADKLEPPLK